MSDDKMVSNLNQNDNLPIVDGTEKADEHNESMPMQDEDQDNPLLLIPAVSNLSAVRDAMGIDDDVNKKKVSLR